MMKGIGLVFAGGGGKGASQGSPLFISFKSSARLLTTSIFSSFSMESSRSVSNSILYFSSICIIPSTFLFSITIQHVYDKICRFNFFLFHIKLNYTLYGTIPVFKFTFLNTRRRKRFMEEDISFCIHEKEIHICARKA